MRCQLTANRAGRPDNQSRGQPEVLITRIRLAFLGGALLALHAWAQDRPLIHGTVTGVLDGNTLRTQLVTGPTVVRLAHIDAPELRQPGGKEARAALHERVIGREVALNVLSRDEDGWLVAVAYPREREPQRVDGQAGPRLGVSAGRGRP